MPAGQSQEVSELRKAATDALRKGDYAAAIPRLERLTAMAPKVPQSLSGDDRYGQCVPPRVAAIPSGLFHHLLALRIEVIHLAIPVGAHGEFYRRHDLVPEVRVAVGLLPRSHAVQEVVNVFEITFIPYALDADQFVAVLLDKLTRKRRFRNDIRVIILPVQQGGDPELLAEMFQRVIPIQKRFAGSGHPALLDDTSVIAMEKMP